MNKIEENFDRLIRLYPKKITYSNLISKKDINLLQNKLSIKIPKELKIYLMNYRLNLLNSDFDILPIKEIINQTNFIRSLGRDKNLLVISAYDDFILCVKLSFKGKNSFGEILEVNPDFDDNKFAYSNLYNFLESIIKEDIEWENKIKVEDEKVNNDKH